jgi:hypothetical protein
MVQLATSWESRSHDQHHIIFIFYFFHNLATQIMTSSQQSWLTFLFFTQWHGDSSNHHCERRPCCRAFRCIVCNSRCSSAVQQRVSAVISRSLYMNICMYVHVRIHIFTHTYMHIFRHTYIKHKAYMLSTSAYILHARIHPYIRAQHTFAGIEHHLSPHPLCVRRRDTYACIQTNT